LASWLSNSAGRAALVLGGCVAGAGTGVLSKSMLAGFPCDTPRCDALDDCDERLEAEPACSLACSDIDSASAARAEEAGPRAPPPLPPPRPAPMWGAGAI